MPWKNQSGGPWGGGPSGQSPWGRGSSGGGGGGGGGQPPNFEDIIRQGQDRLRSVLPGGGGGSPRAIAVIALIGVAIWLASGFYRVQPDEQGVVLRFGEWVRTTQPGLNYHLPYPIESVETPRVTRVNRVEVGYRQADGQGSSIRAVSEEALMLTGDENIADVNFAVFWVIKDAGQYLFNIRQPEQTVKAAAESAMREVIGFTPIASALAEGRSVIEEQTTQLMQRILDDYGAGIEVTRLELRKVDPPGAVIDAFRDVQRARADQERLRNEAEAYRNDLVPRARGQAEQIIQDAEAYREEVVARAEGDAERFRQVMTAYTESREVTTQRIYLETMEAVLGGMEKVLIDNGADGAAGQGVVPYLPLPELQRRQRDADGNDGQSAQARENR